MPMLVLAGRRHGVGLFLLKHLPGEAVEQPLDRGAAEAGDAGPPRPTVAVAEELTGEAAAGREPLPDPRPNLEEPRRRAERQSEAGVDQRRYRPFHILETRDQGSERGVLRQIGSRPQPADGGFFGV